MQFQEWVDTVTINSNTKKLLHEAYQKGYAHGEDEAKNPVYCEVCGSCGESGCCPPDRCKTVQGLYCEENVKSFKEMQDELNSFILAVNELKKYFTSGNEIPVERATITTVAFNEIFKKHNLLEEEVNGN